MYLQDDQTTGEKAMNLRSIDLCYDGTPTSAPEDARLEAEASAVSLIPTLNPKYPTTVYRVARASNDTPEGPWVYAKPPCRSYWRASFAALALSLLLPLAVQAAPQKVPRHTVKPLSSITVKVVPDQDFQRKAAQVGLVAGQSYVITAHDLDGCTAWVTERASDIAQYAAFKACRKAIDNAVDAAHAAAEKGDRP